MIVAEYEGREHFFGENPHLVFTDNLRLAIKLSELDAKLLVSDLGFKELCKVSKVKNPQLSLIEISTR